MSEAMTKWEAMSCTNGVRGGASVTLYFDSLENAHEFQDALRDEVSLSAQPDPGGVSAGMGAEAVERLRRPNYGSSYVDLRNEGYNAALDDVLALLPETTRKRQEVENTQ